MLTKRLIKQIHRFSTGSQVILNQERFAEEVDVCIVGGGPAGLSAAIRIRQKSIQEGKEVRVMLVEKGSDIGSLF